MNAIEKAAEALGRADALFITAGAGMGVDSGLPDFRGNHGFWRYYPPIAKLGISFEEMANPHWFEVQPKLAWAFYGHRLNLYRKTAPHRGFAQILEIAEEKSGGYFVFTSNVDGQFQKAGYSKERIVECHGSIHHLQCTSPCSEEIRDGSQTEVEVDEEIFEAREPLPHCACCGGLARPNILMFGDLRWIPSRTGAQTHRLARWLEDARKAEWKLAIVEVGAGHAVPTVRMQSESIARKLGGTLIRINPRDAHGPPGHISIPFGGAEGIGRIYESLKAT